MVTSGSPKSAPYRQVGWVRGGTLSHGLQAACSTFRRDDVRDSAGLALGMWAPCGRREGSGESVLGRRPVLPPG